MKKMNYLSALILLLGFSVAGCKEPPPPPRPTPTPTHTPVPADDLIGFTQGGRLMAVAWAGDKLRVLYDDDRKSIWFPSAANAKAQQIEDAYGKAGPHYLAWLRR